MHGPATPPTLQDLFLEAQGTASTLAVPERSHLYNCGDPADEIYLVLSGRLKASGYAEDGKSCLLAVFGPGDLVGEGSLDGDRRQETVSATRHAVVRRMTAGAFLEAVSEQRLVAALARHLVRRLSEQQRVIKSFATQPSEQRLGAVLISLSRRFGRHHPAGVYIDARLTHEELARMVGTTRSRIGAFLKTFGDQGWVRTTQAGLVVTDTPKLAAHAGVQAPESGAG